MFNGSPSAISGWLKQGGLVPLTTSPTACPPSRAAAATAAAEYKSSDGKYYQLPWKSNPVMIFYNKDMFKAAGLDPDHPALSTYADFLAAAQKLVGIRAPRSTPSPGADQ